jgi:4-hydroxy-3-polyprenylbenzoate decarboxylase
VGFDWPDLRGVLEKLEDAGAAAPGIAPEVPVPLPGGRGQTFMPSERMTAGDKQWTASNTEFEGGMGIDATVPYGYESDFHRPVYPVDRVNPEKFFSADDIALAKSRMSGWLLSLARTGR